MVLFTGIPTRNPRIGVMQLSAFDVKMEEMICKLISPVPDGEAAHGVGEIHVNIHIHLLLPDDVEGNQSCRRNETDEMRRGGGLSPGLHQLGGRIMR